MNFLSSQMRDGTIIGTSNDGGVLALSTTGFRPTYHYTALDITPVATATDVLTLTGVAGKVIRVTKVTIMGSATASAIYDVYLVKRTIANGVGTSTNPIPTLSDTTDPVASGVLTLYTANPASLGTGTNLEAAKTYLGTAAITSPQINFIWGNRGDKAPVLRAGETLAINFAGAAVPTGTSLYLTFEWTEDNI